VDKSIKENNFTKIIKKKNKNEKDKLIDIERFKNFLYNLLLYNRNENKIIFLLIKINIFYQ
jgi:hypothetical protein